jgi:hypothetical protein
MGAGVKEIIFKGITEAFLASAQFNDLLAPIQQVIRDFTQQAIASGETPDLGAFRSALLPKIEDVSTRANLLAPLIAEIQKLGLDVTGSITKLFGGGQATRAATININIAEFTGSDQDVNDLARKLDDMLRGQLSAM